MKKVNDNGMEAGKIGGAGKEMMSGKIGGAGKEMMAGKGIEAGKVSGVAEGERPVYLLETIDDYNKLYGLPTLHPLVTVVNLADASTFIRRARMNYGVYALFLKQGKGCALKYGREYYDYQEGTVVCFAPGQTVEVEVQQTDFTPDARGLLFHPDLIYGTSLGKKISKYHFFAYDQKEALHLSEQERELFLDCLERIKAEMEHGIDKHSRELLAVNIELLLEYCMRFYDRQFITREKVNSDVMEKFERCLNEYFDKGLAEQNGLPSVKYFAERVFLSPGYFGDLVKKETGRTAQEYIQAKIIDRAKEALKGTDDPVADVAWMLGFQYPQHFTRLFKKVVGMTPVAYRNS